MRKERMVGIVCFVGCRDVKGGCELKEKRM